MEVDASNLSETEIYDRLKAAWTQGHDKVALRNYTAPSGRTGDVVVVRDLAQLRDPKADFDPAKRNWWDVMASLAGAGLLGPYFAGTPSAMRDQ